MAISLEVNGEGYVLEISSHLPLLWVLREHLGLTGTKYGCGIGRCGACTVHLDGEARRSCVIPVSEVQGRKVTTIEGLPKEHPVKAAWIAEQVPQCGYCQPGQVMQAAVLLAEIPSPTDEEIAAAMDGNLCRCGTYPRILRAIKRAARARGEP